jgi:hypothetical protein
MRLIGLNWSLIDGRSEIGRGFFAPKKTEGLVTRETERPLTNDDGLDEAPGVKVLAAGFGLNSMAFTLNLLETAEVGVCVLFGLDMPG